MDEYTYAQYLDPVVYKERMVKHWDTFYTKEEFAKLAACKLSHLNGKGGRAGHDPTFLNVLLTVSSTR